MGPFDVQRQSQRADAVRRILSRPNITPWARQFWSKTLRDLCFCVDNYNERVYTVYSQLDTAELYNERRF